MEYLFLSLLQIASLFYVDAMFMYVITIYASMIYTAPCVMFLMRADTLRGQVGGGWALEMESFLGPVKVSYTIHIEHKRTVPSVASVIFCNNLVLNVQIAIVDMSNMKYFTMYSYV